MPFDYAQMQALAAVIRRGSFDRAAAELALTPSAISQRIRGLEDRLGAVLVERSQPVRPTEAGARLMRHYDLVTLLERDLDQALRPADDGPATVRIAVNADSLATWFVPALIETEGLIFDLVIDDQDHSLEALRRGVVVAALTSRAEPVQGATSHALGVLRYCATASPAFMARWFAAGVTPEAVSRAPVMAFNAKDRLLERWLAAHLGNSRTGPEHRIASPEAFLAATLGGIGWAMNPEVLVRDHLASGALVTVAPHVLDVPLYWQVSRLAGEALAPLTRAVRRAAAAMLIAG
ncbi:MAG: LysR family transcriptional regulator ArgP [Paracoccaceae bacterium]